MVVSFNELKIIEYVISDFYDDIKFVFSVSSRLSDLIGLITYQFVLVQFKFFGHFNT